MNNTITFEYGSNKYTLEFDRKSVRAMENAGFNITELATKPVNTYYELFVGAFRKHHRTIKSDKIDEIYDVLDDKENLHAKLIDMYCETVRSILGNAETDENEDNSNLISWE